MATAFSNVLRQTTAEAGTPVGHGYTVTHYVAPYTEAAGSPANDYVDQGSTAWSNATSISTPCTLGTAMARATAGNVVEIAPGQYVGAVTGGRFSPSFSPANSGSINNQIVFVAENRAGISYQEGVTTELRSGTSTQGSGNPAYGVANQNYVIWDGIFVNEANSGSTDDTGPVTLSGSTGSEVRHAVVLRIPPSWSSNHNAFRFEQCVSCVLSDSYTNHSDLGSAGGENSAAFMMYNSDDCIVEHNEFHNQPLAIWWKGDTATPKDSSGNLTRFNKIVGGMDGIKVSAAYAGGDRSQVYANVIYDHSGVGITFKGFSSAEPQNVDVVNNTVVGGEYSFYMLESWASTLDYRLRNNIFSGATIGLYRSNYFPSDYGHDPANTLDNLLGVYDMDYSLYHDYAQFGWKESGDTAWHTLTFAGTQASPYLRNLNSIDGSDPLFSNAANDDYSLGGSSPALNAGLDILNLLGGGTSAAINMGAYFASEVPGRRSE